MPDLCRGGGAHANTSYGTIVVVTAAAAEAALLKFVNKNVAEVLAPIIAGVSYNLTALCGDFAPDDPGLTADDIGDALNPANPLTWVPAVSKVRQWFLSWYWTLVCICDDGGAVGAVSPSAPSDVGSNPGLPPGSPGAPCWDITRAAVRPAGSAVMDISTSYLPAGATHSVTPGYGGAPTTGYAIPTGVTTFTSTVTVDPFSGAPNSDGYLYMYGSTGTVVATSHLWTNSGAGTTFTQGPVTVPGTAVYWNMFVDGSTTDDTSFNLHFSFLCSGGGGPGTIVQPCCPPDPLLQQTINQIYGMVTLIQRQLVPFAYIHGTAHSSLTGSGELSLQGVLGVKIEPGSIPGDAGIEAGDPDVLWLSSWVNWGNDDGWLTREWLRVSPQVSFPPYAGQFTRLGYSIRPGLAVDITELVREAP